MLVLASACAEDPASNESAVEENIPSLDPSLPVSAIPTPRSGSDVLGTSFDLEAIERWVGTPPPTGSAAPGATLVRFWTDTCPFCEASLPALQSIANEYRDQGLVTVGLYHPKPPRDVSDEEVSAAAAERGFSEYLGVDRDWEVLSSVWLDSGRRDATSASFLLDAEGKIRFVHPGPLFHPASEDHGMPTLAEDAARDYEDLRRAVAALFEGR